jgi:capsular exopolysaccharide synthesis family protein
MDPLRVQAPQETKLHFLDYWRIIRIRKTVILAVFLLVVITATLVTFILPEYYSSTCRIKVDRDVSDIKFADPMAPQGTYDPYFIQTEFETIQSERVLSNVANDPQMDLKNEWGKRYGDGRPLNTAEVVSQLKNRGKVSVSPVRNTLYMEISVLSEKPKEAADLANAIAKAYKDYRHETRKTLTAGGIIALKDQMAEQEKKISDQQKQVDDWREKLKVPDSVAYGEQPTALFTAETFRRLEGLRIETQTEYVKQKTVFDDLKALAPQQLEQVLPTGANDSLLSSLLEQRSFAEQKLVQLKKDYGPQHPEFSKTTELIEDLNKKINARVEGIMISLTQKVESSKKALDQIVTEVEDAKAKDIAAASQFRPYFEAKQKLEELKRFNQILQMKYATENIENSLPKTTMVEIMDDARPALHPAKPNKALNIVLGIVVGLVVGVGLAFFIEYLDTSVKTIDDVERSLQSPVLGVIPQNVGLVLEEGVDSPHAEAYRVLRTNLLFSRKDDKLNTVAVVSAGAGEGKSTTVFNLASVFAQSRHRVLMVDSDLRRPTLHKMLRISNSLGLTNYLLKQNTLEEVIQTTSLPTLDFLASGKLPSSSLGILSSAQMKDLITELKRRYDFVFFDSPPIMGVSDASILASEVDMTLQVIQYRRYPQPMNIRAKQLIEKVGGNLVGIVLNNINMSQDESYYYYSGYYHDYYSRNEDQEPAARPETASAERAEDETKS